MDAEDFFPMVFGGMLLFVTIPFWVPALLAMRLFKFLGKGLYE